MFQGLAWLKIPGQGVGRPVRRSIVGVGNLMHGLASHDRQPTYSRAERGVNAGSYIRELLCSSTSYRDLGQILCQGHLPGRRNTLRFPRVSLFLRHRGTRSQSEDDGDGRIQNKNIATDEACSSLLSSSVFSLRPPCHSGDLASTSAAGAAGRTIQCARNPKLGTFIALSSNCVEAIEIALENVNKCIAK